MALGAPIVIRATKLLDGTTATSSTIMLVGDAGVVTTTVTAAGDTVTVTPSAALNPGAPYLVTMVQLGASAVMWDDSGLTTGTVYTYYVEPVNAVGPGAWSSPTSVTAP